MSSEVFNLDRETNIAANVDALGKKWIIHANKQTGLCYVRPEPDREDAVIPKILRGKWTKPSIVLPLIQQYVTATWDHADKVTTDNERTKQAAKELAAKDELDDARDPTTERPIQA